MTTGVAGILVAVGVGAAVGVALAVAVCVCVAMAAGVEVGVGICVAIAVGISVAVGVAGVTRGPTQAAVTAIRPMLSPSNNLLTPTPVSVPTPMRSRIQLSSFIRR